MAYRYEKKIDCLHLKLKDLHDLKVEKADEEKAMKTKQKKIDRKEKALKEREAKIELERVRFERIKAIDTTKSIDVEIKDENKNERNTMSENLYCSHFPQCFTRNPYPPPLGPITLKQFEVEEEIRNNEKEQDSEIAALLEDIMNFACSEPRDDIDHTIAKIAALKNLLEPNKEALNSTRNSLG